MPRQPTGDRAKAAKWRRQAARCRAECKSTTDASSRRALLLIAAFYERLADQAEARPQGATKKNSNKHTGATANGAAMNKKNPAEAGSS